MNSKSWAENVGFLLFIALLLAWIVSFVIRAVMEPESSNADTLTSPSQQELEYVWMYNPVYQVMLAHLVTGAEYVPQTIRSTACGQEIVGGLDRGVGWGAFTEARESAFPCPACQQALRPFVDWQKDKLARPFPSEIPHTESQTAK